jgi:ketosteroid isomerase-like protein
MQQPPPRAGPASGDTGEVSTRNIELVRESIEAANRGDLEWLLEHAASDIELRSRGVAGEPVLYTGPAGIREYFRDMADIWQSMESAPEDIRELGDRVIAIVNRRLRGRGSGIDVEDKIGIIFELRDGVAVRVSTYRNVEEALAEAGFHA